MVSDDWAFHLMMAAFFFATVIVMLNVLIGKCRAIAEHAKKK